MRNKLQSRKLWALLVWVAISICVMIFAPEFTGHALIELGVITSIYIGVQGYIDCKLQNKNS